MRVALSDRPIRVAISWPSNPCAASSRAARPSGRRRARAACSSASRSRCEELGFRARRLAPVQEARHDPEPGRHPPAAGDGEIGRHAVEPGPDVVRHPTGSGLADEADERVLEDVLSDLAVAGHRDEEGEDLAPVLQVEVTQLDLVRPGGRVERFRDWDHLLRHGRLGHPVHTDMTRLAWDCRNGLDGGHTRPEAEGQAAGAVASPCGTLRASAKDGIPAARPPGEPPDRRRVKLLHFSDLHLDAQFAWAGPEAARKRRENLRSTLLRIVELARAEGVDAVLSGGDLYEHERITPDTAGFLRSAFAGLDPIPVFLAPGNHDWFGPASAYERVAWTPNVHVFRHGPARAGGAGERRDPVGRRPSCPGQHRRLPGRLPGRSRRREPGPVPCRRAGRAGLPGIGQGAPCRVRRAGDRGGRAGPRVPRPLPRPEGRRPAHLSRQPRPADLRRGG